MTIAICAQAVETYTVTNHGYVLHPHSFCYLGRLYSAYVICSMIKSWEGAHLSIRLRAVSYSSSFQ